MKVSIIYATRIRPDMLETSLTSLLETTQGYDLEIIVVVDRDIITYKRFKNDSRITKIVQNRKRLGPSHSWNRGLSISTGDIIVPASDDIIFEPHWLTKALQAHQDNLGGYGVVGINSRIHDVNILSGMYLFDRKFCKDHLGGVISPPHYRHMFTDKEIDAKTKAIGKFYGCAESVVTHVHPCENRRKPDFNDKWRETLWIEETAIYERRLLAGFPIDFEPVI